MTPPSYCLLTSLRIIVSVCECVRVSVCESEQFSGSQLPVQCLHQSNGLSVVYFSSSSPSLMLLTDAEAPFGEVGGEGRALCQRVGGDGGDGGEGERRGESSRGGLLQGDSLGERA